MSHRDGHLEEPLSGVGDSLDGFLVDEHEVLRRSPPSVHWQLAGAVLGDVGGRGDLAEVVPLLRTELDDRAREACKEYSKRWGNGDEVVVSVGRDIIAAEKPVERWTVLCPDKGCALFVYDNGANTGKSFPHDAEPEARAYVARKNAESAR